MEDNGFMGDGYIAVMARKSAQDLSGMHGIDISTAYSITYRLLHEARSAVMKIVGEYGAENWKSMSIEDKSAICTEVVSGLLDKEKVEGLINGSRKALN